MLWFEYKTIEKMIFKRHVKKVPVEGEYINFTQDGKPSALDYSIEYNYDGNTI